LERILLLETITGNRQPQTTIPPPTPPPVISPAKTKPPAAWFRIKEQLMNNADLEKSGARDTASVGLGGHGILEKYALHVESRMAIAAPQPFKIPQEVVGRPAITELSEKYELEMSGGEEGDRMKRAPLQSIQKRQEATRDLRRKKTHPVMATLPSN
jgi:hypothetical protein